ncbi:MAG: hypothetical protein OXJ54_17020 [Gemmatimonadetes bacterium]|nr:hypothetical protein [Candidatus Palauibacter rhopaloidicola]
MTLLDSPIIDLAVALIFIYVVLSLLASSVQEWIASLFGLRARNLYQGVRRLLGAQYAQEVYEHPMIRRLAKQDRWPVREQSAEGRLGKFVSLWRWLFPKAPSYIDHRTLRAVLTTVVKDNGNGAADDGSETAETDDVHRILKTICPTGEITDPEAIQAFSAWFDEGMTRVSGWYKRKAKLWIVGVAAVITIGTDASTIHIAEKIWMDDALRSVLTEQASALVENGATDEQLESHFSGALESLPIGWRGGLPTDGTEWLKSGVGWLITIAASASALPSGSTS